MSFIFHFCQLNLYFNYFIWVTNTFWMHPSKWKNNTWRIIQYSRSCGASKETQVQFLAAISFTTNWFFSRAAGILACLRSTLTPLCINPPTDTPHTYLKNNIISVNQYIGWGLMNMQLWVLYFKKNKNWMVFAIIWETWTVAFKCLWRK